MVGDHKIKVKVKSEADRTAKSTVICAPLFLRIGEKEDTESGEWNG